MTTPSTLRPSIDDFRRFGWLPASKKKYDDWMDDLHKRVYPEAKKMPGPGTPYSVVIDGAPEPPPLLKPIQEFKDFIESNAMVYTDIVRMFEGIEEAPTSYQEMLLMFNEIFRQAPDFNNVGPPMYMIMSRVMNTQGGFSAFTKESLNHHFKKMMKTWELYLLSPQSTSTLNTGPGGWFSSSAMEQMMMEYPNRTFEEVYVCDPGAPAWGYTSYEDFFIRRYRSPATDRPTGDIQDLRIISAACESALYAIKTKVQKTDELFIKDEAYSLVHLLAGDESVDYFVGGLVIQSFLNTTGYHRWHAPVNGTIVKIVDVPGTYFAQAPSTIGEPLESEGELPPYLRSLTYFANTAARQLIFIDADNKKIGLMCFIAIGMTEISTCQATVYEGQHVNRGEELGMFHFGGSSCALVFREAANVRWAGPSEPPVNLRINAPIAVADIDA